jgi:hypothetical protein
MTTDILNEPDWNAAEAVLVEKSRSAIEHFATQHPAELCSFVAFSVDYCFGEVVICFDTYDNSLLHAKRYEARTLKTWNGVLCEDRGWENAHYYIQRDRLSSHNPHTADFKYHHFARLHFSEWEAYFGNDQLPESPDPLGHVIVLLHKVISKLVAAHSFDQLKMTSPFRVGAEFPRDDHDLIVMRLLNWPSHQGPRV